ncbi:MAG: GNAT family N-acetyltransferase [Phycisphaerales bacterium]|nr:GNAT family N-acetyltransferase [Phycisphaerales bacterium]
MATIPRQRQSKAGYRLEAFGRDHAELVAAWAPTVDDCWRVAPRTAPPLSAAKVLEWGREGEPLSLFRVGAETPVAYAELNLLNRVQATYWIGHVLVDPAERGQGVGRELMRQVLWRAFNVRGASRVSLVVFPDNPAAIACYKSVGMNAEGWESHNFPAYGRRERLMRFVATRS